MFSLFLASFQLLYSKQKAADFLQKDNNYWGFCSLASFPPTKSLSTELSLQSTQGIAQHSGMQSSWLSPGLGAAYR